MSGKLDGLPGWNRQLDEQIVAGRLVRRDEPVVTSSSQPLFATISVQAISTGNLVAALLRSGVWRHAKDPDGKAGMSEIQYGDLWPGEVVMPVGYADRYPHLLLIDQTLKTKKLRACVDAEFFSEPSNCRVLAGIPRFLVGIDGRPLARSVVFWGYKQNLNRSGVNCRKEATVTNIPLVHSDGLWIIIEHGDGILLFHAVDLCGSSSPGGLYAPYVDRFNDDRPLFNVHQIVDHRPGWGSGFRGSEVVAVP